MNKPPFDYSLYLITDGKPNLLERTRQALQGGVTCIQYREKNKPFPEMVIEARTLKKLCHQYGVPLFINDHLDLAKEIEADGLHLGQTDATILEARNKLGDIPIGITASCVKEAAEAEANGAVYLGVGAIFPTASKQDATMTSQKTAKAIKQTVNIPILLIGGISLETAPTITIPYDGLCVISAILSAQNPREEAAKLKQLIRHRIGK